MTQRTFRAFALLPCAALIPGASAMQASAVKLDRFEIPFEFKVQHKTLPAGQY